MVMARCSDEFCTKAATEVCAVCDAFAERDRFVRLWFKGGWCIDGIRALKRGRAFARLRRYAWLMVWSWNQSKAPQGGYFELTPEQKGMLATLSRETGKSIPALLAEALEVLQAHQRLTHETSNGYEAIAPAAAETTKPFWQKALEASERIPEEELARLPADLAAHLDHYIYGTPKR